MIPFKDAVFLFIQEHEEEMIKASIEEARPRRLKHRVFLKACMDFLDELDLFGFVHVPPSSEYKLQLNNTKQYKMQYADHPENLDLIKILAEEVGVSQAHYLRTLIHSFLQLKGYKPIETRYKRKETPKYTEVELDQLLEEEVATLSLLPAFSLPCLEHLKPVNEKREDK